MWEIYMGEGGHVRKRQQDAMTFSWARVLGYFLFLFLLFPCALVAFLLYLFVWCPSDNGSKIQEAVG